MRLFHSTKVQVILIGLLAFLLLPGWPKDNDTALQGIYGAQTVAEAYETRNPYIRTGLASWYSRRSPGVKRRTANNEKFNDRKMTCAMWGVPFNHKVRVTNLRNGKSVTLRVNDRGPHVRYVKKGRIIDLTKAAFAKIGDTKTGLIEVSVEFLRESS